MVLYKYPPLLHFLANACRIDSTVFLSLKLCSKARPAARQAAPGLLHAPLGTCPQNRAHFSAAQGEGMPDAARGPGRPGRGREGTAPHFRTRPRRYLSSPDTFLLLLTISHQDEFHFLKKIISISARNGSITTGILFPKQ